MLLDCFYSAREFEPCQRLNYATPEYSGEKPVFPFQCLIPSSRFSPSRCRTWESFQSEPERASGTAALFSMRGRKGSNESRYNGDVPNQNKVIRVFIVDDHPVVRLGLRTMLESEEGIHVVGMASSGREATVAVPSCAPDVVLMDLRMPEMEGTEAIVELRKASPEVRILVLTNYESDEYITSALQAGARGYLLKNTPQDEIVRAVEAVARNERCVPERIAQRLLDAMERTSLSQREIEVLKLVARGLTNKEIAQKLSISDKTARNHVVSCLEKLNVDDRTEATTTAIARGIIRIDE